MNAPGDSVLGRADELGDQGVRDRARRLGVVRRTKPAGARKFAWLDSGERLEVPRYAVVGPGDELHRDGHGIFVPLENGSSRLLPAYERGVSLPLGSERYRAAVKEIDSDDELEAYRRLAALHYRSDKSFGRKAVLILAARSRHLPRVLGYVEITTGFLMNSPRTRVLAGGFRDGGVAWSAWGSREMRELTSLIGRVSRLVVHPDLRGQGLGTILLEHAGKFARSHFHAGGLRPLFLELSADMTKFVPFAERAGMRYVGQTEGNVHRVARDIRYLLGKSSLTKTPTSDLRARGIMQAQRRYAASASLLAASGGIGPLTDELANLNGFVGTDAYARFFGILRLPRPAYLMGLTRPARRFVETRVEQLGIPRPDAFTPPPLDPLSQPIETDALCLWFESSVARTERSTEIQEAFGIRPDYFRSLVLQQLSLTIQPGSVTLLYGPSGSGKTTLLNLLSGVEASADLHQEGTITLPANARIGRFQDLPPDRPLIEVLAQGGPTRRALYALNMAGLSDAKLYLRSYGELSNGQKYRAMLAALIDSDANVWIADEFLSTLDPITAATVAANIVEHVAARRVTLVVGAPHFDSFVEVLRPDVVVRLVSPWEHYVLGGRAFVRKWRSSARNRAERTILR